MSEKETGGLKKGGAFEGLAPFEYLMPVPVRWLAILLEKMTIRRGRLYDFLRWFFTAAPIG